jgi:hypothetical protein
MGIFDKLFRNPNNNTQTNIYTYIKPKEDINAEIVRLKVIFKDNPVGLSIDEMEDIVMSFIFSKDKQELNRAMNLANEALKLECSVKQRNRINELKLECQEKLGM